MLRQTNDPNTPQKARQEFPLIWIFAAAAVLLVAGVALWRTSAESGPAKMGPRLRVDQEKIDFGRVPLDKPVTAVFMITNVGDSTLTLDASSPIQVLAGC